jgi:hypothetical protein
MIVSRVRRIGSSRLFALFALLATIALLPGSFAPTFFPNEDVYLPRLIRASRLSPLRSDWTLERLAPDRPLFDLVFKPLARIGNPTLIVQIGRPISWLIFIAGFGWFVAGLGFKSPIAIVGILGVWLVPFPYTASQEWIIGPFESKPFAWGALFAMMAAVGRRQRLLAAVLTIACVGFHIVLGFWCCVLFGGALFATERAVVKKDRVSSWFQAGLVVAVGSIGAIAMALPMLRFSTKSPASVADTRLFTRTLWGLHFDPWQFPNRTIWLLFIASGSVLLAVRDKPETNLRAWQVLAVVEIVSVLASVGGIFARLLDRDEFLMLMPFRVSPVIIPLGAILRVARLLSRWKSTKDGRVPLHPILAAAAVVIAIGHFAPPLRLAQYRVQALRSSWRPAPTAESVAAHWVDLNTEPGSVIASDPGQSVFGEANRPMVGSFLTAPTNDLAAWKLRMLALSGVDISNNTIGRSLAIRNALTAGFNARDQSQVASWATSYGVTHVMTRATYSFELLTTIGPIHIYRLPSRDVAVGPGVSPAVLLFE